MTREFYDLQAEISIKSAGTTTFLTRIEFATKID